MLGKGAEVAEALLLSNRIFMIVLIAATSANAQETIVFYF